MAVSDDARRAVAAGTGGRLRAWVVHATGNANVRAVLSGLDEADLLECYWTTLGWPESAWWRGLLPAKYQEKAARRAYALPRGQIQSWALPEVRRLARRGGDRSAGATRARVDEVYRALGERVARALRRRAEDKLPEVVYAYEDGAEAVFRAARERGCRTVYDLPIGYGGAARRLLEEEAERSPAWAMTLAGLAETPAKRAWKNEEIALADRILVASSFTAATLREYPGTLPPVQVIPYGTPPVAAAPPTPRAIGAPLRVIFVGGLSQRKGLSDLFAAVDGLGAAVRLTVVGRRPAGCAALDAALGRHRHLATLSPAGVLAELRQHDVLVFPSLFEGFGLVITEALSQGLAVVTTPHTAGPDLLTDGREGRLVPIRRPDLLAAALADLAADGEQLRAMQEAALVRARELRWDRYGQVVAQAVAEVGAGG